MEQSQFGECCLAPSPPLREQRLVWVLAAALTRHSGGTHLAVSLTIQQAFHIVSAHNGEGWRGDSQVGSKRRERRWRGRWKHSEYVFWGGNLSNLAILIAVYLPLSLQPLAATLCNRCWIRWLNLLSSRCGAANVGQRHNNSNNNNRRTVRQEQILNCATAHSVTTAAAKRQQAAQMAWQLVLPHLLSNWRCHLLPATLENRFNLHLRHKADAKANYDR